METTAEVREGARLGAWLVLGPAESSAYEGSRHQARRWRVRCSGCGRAFLILERYLRRGKLAGCASCRQRTPDVLELRRRIAAADLRGLSLREIAREVGVSKSYVSDVLDMPASALREPPR